MTARISNDAIIAAYKATGSVWKAGKRLGISGQSVHERLRGLGYPLYSRKWSDEEIAELRLLLSQMPLGKAAERLGRPYAGVACKASELGFKGKRAERIKIPRGAGYDKASLTKYAKEIDRGNWDVTAYARSKALGVEMLARSFEMVLPEWWEKYRREHSELPETTCAYCGGRFVPSTGKQLYCTRKCGADARADRAYFGGNRRKTVGLLEATCQLCERHVEKGLTPHHIIGKENDPDDELLVALCRGCHQLVSLLGGRTFVDTPDGWERLIGMVWLLRNGSSLDDAIGTYVEVIVEPLLAENPLFQQEVDMA